MRVCRLVQRFPRCSAITRVEVVSTPRPWAPYRGACLRSRTKGFDLVRPRRHKCQKPSLTVFCRQCYRLLICYASRQFAADRGKETSETGSGVRGDVPSPGERWKAGHHHPSSPTPIGDLPGGRGHSLPCPITRNVRGYRSFSPPSKSGPGTFPHVPGPLLASPLPWERTQIGDLPQSQVVK